MVLSKRKFEIASQDTIVLSRLLAMTWSESLKSFKLMQKRIGHGDDTLEECVQSPPRKRSRLSSPPPKRVSFAEDRNTINHHDYSTEDIQRSWLGDDEYQAIRAENKATILTIKSANCSLGELDASKICLRGLEEQVSIVIFRACRTRQKKFVERILKRQFIQRKMGISEPDAIGSLSFAMSKNDRSRALKAASIDASC